MAEYEGIDTFAIAEKEYEGFPDCGCVSVGAIEDVIRGVLGRLQADGRLITGEVGKQYGRRDFEDGLVVGPLPDKPQPTRFFEPVFRYVSGWQPVSDIGNDRPVDNETEKP